MPTRREPDSKRTRHGIVFRARFRPRERWWTIGVMIPLTAILVLIASILLPRPLDDPSRQWGGISMSLAFLTTVFLGCGVLMPQSLLRMTPHKIQCARRGFLNRRVEMRWDEIKRVCCSDGAVSEVRAGRCGILLTAKDRYVRCLLRAEAASHLSRFFDLSTPTPFDLRMQAHRNRTWSKRIIDWVLLFAIGLVFASILMAGLMWSQGAGSCHSLRTATPFAIFLISWALVMRKMIREARGQWKWRETPGA